MNAYRIFASVLMGWLWLSSAGCGLGSEPQTNGHSMSYWIGRTDFAPLISFHGEGGFRERKEAFNALAKIGAPAVPALVKIVSDPKRKWDRRWSAVAALAEIGPPAIAAAPALRAAMFDASISQNQFYEIPSALRKIGASKEAVPELTKWLEQTDPIEERHRLCIYECAMTLAEAGPAARPAIPVLVSYLKQQLATPDDWGASRREECTALGAIGDSRPEVLAVLKLAKADKNEQVRASATAALKRLEDARLTTKDRPSQ